MRSIHLALLLIVWATALGGCAVYSPSSDIIGQDRNALVAKLGRPEREYESDGKRKLQFPRGPDGSHTYFVYLDNNDRVSGWEQVLTEERFDQILPGMPKEQVIDLIGASKITRALARERGEVWHYRFWNIRCASFVIEFTKEGVVRSAGYRIRGGRQCRYVGQ